MWKLRRWEEWCRCTTQNIISSIKVGKKCLGAVFWQHLFRTSCREKLEPLMEHNRDRIRPVARILPTRGAPATQEGRLDHPLVGPPVTEGAAPITEGAMPSNAHLNGLWNHSELPLSYRPSYFKRCHVQNQTVPSSSDADSSFPGVLRWRKVCPNIGCLTSCNWRRRANWTQDLLHAEQVIAQLLSSV